MKKTLSITCILMLQKYDFNKFKNIEKRIINIESFQNQLKKY